MIVTLIGNCQIVPLRKILTMLQPDLRIESLPAVHQMKPEHEGRISDLIASSDVVLAQPVEDNYPVEFIRTSNLKSIAHNKLLIWPNMYFKGYAPDFDVIRDPEYINFHGPLLDYHSEKIILSFLKGWNIEAATHFFVEETAYDEKWYATSIDDAIRELRRREISTTVVISDFIEENFSKIRLFHIMNHPAVALILEMACRILKQIGLKYPRPQASMFNDLDMTSAHYAENKYIKQRYSLDFEMSGLYRGVRLEPNNSILKFAAKEPQIYTPESLVKAFYDFYEPHRERLATNGRGMGVLRRGL